MVPRSHGSLPRVGHSLPGGRSQPFSMVQVLQQTPSPAGPMLYLSPVFTSWENQEKLEQFIRQFICS